MDNLKERSLQVAYGLFGVFWLMLAAGFIVQALELFPDFDLQGFVAGPVGIPLLYGLGGLSAIAGFYFLRRLGEALRSFRTFEHQSDFGQIYISHRTVKELTQEIVKENLDIPSFKTALAPSEEGVDIRIEARVRAGADISSLGEKLQQLLSDKIHERTGLNVAHVDFYTRGVEEDARKSSGEQSVDPKDEEIKVQGEDHEA